MTQPYDWVYIFKDITQEFMLPENPELIAFMDNNKKIIQLIWGFALLLMGIAIFFRIPQVIDRIREIQYFIPIMPFIRFCFYIIGIILVGGGVKKIYLTYLKAERSEFES